MFVERISLTIAFQYVCKDYQIEASSSFYNDVWEQVEAFKAEIVFIGGQTFSGVSNENNSIFWFFSALKTYNLTHFYPFKPNLEWYLVGFRIISKNTVKLKSLSLRIILSQIDCPFFYLFF
jgi:hypothetical protein